MPRKRKPETEEDIADQIMWLRRTKWKKKYPWQARVVAVSGNLLRPGRTGAAKVSGEDQRHSYHAEEIEELVDSRETLPDGRIVETPPEGRQPAENPPNVIRGNNADL